MRKRYAITEMMSEKNRWLVFEEQKDRRHGRYDWTAKSRCIGFCVTFERALEMIPPEAAFSIVSIGSPHHQEFIRRRNGHAPEPLM